MNGLVYSASGRFFMFTQAGRLDSQVSSHFFQLPIPSLAILRGRSLLADNRYSDRAVNEPLQVVSSATERHGRPVSP